MADDEKPETFEQIQARTSWGRMVMIPEGASEIAITYPGGRHYKVTLVDHPLGRTVKLAVPPPMPPVV